MTRGTRVAAGRKLPRMRVACCVLGFDYGELPINRTFAMNREKASLFAVGEWGSCHCAKAQRLKGHGVKAQDSFALRKQGMMYVA